MTREMGPYREFLDRVAPRGLDSLDPSGPPTLGLPSSTGTIYPRHIVPSETASEVSSETYYDTPTPYDPDDIERYEGAEIREYGAGIRRYDNRLGNALWPTVVAIELPEPTVCVS